MPLNSWIIILLCCLKKMIGRTKKKREIDKTLLEKIHTKSWKSKIEEIKDVLYGNLK